MRRIWAGIGLVLLATALVFGVGTANAATPTTILVEVIGNGEVTGTGIDCGEGHTTCYATYSETSGTVDLTATAAASWSFDGWDSSSTDCAATTTNPCSVPKDGAGHRLEADFSTASSSPTHTLSVSVPLDSSSKGGEVTDSPSPPGTNADCGSGGVGKCTWNVIDQSTLTVVQTPDAAYVFNGWGGDCSGTGLSCTVQMTADRNVSASFSSSSAPTPLTVTIVGNGTVTGSGISCGSGSTCTANEPSSSAVTLTAHASSGYTFLGWGATGGAAAGLDCSGTQATCTVQMSQARSVTATFAVTKRLDLTVTGSGNVSGGTGAGAINCGNGGSTCSGDEQQDKTVTLTASAAFGSTFLGWDGACTGLSTSCTITMNTDKKVSANFRSATFKLSVAVNGTGTVSGSGITCGTGASVCSSDVTANSTVTLSAAPGSGASFTGWTGACSGSQTTCTFSMTDAKSVTATFGAGGAPPPTATTPLSVAVSGKGSITGGGISCGNGGVVCNANETVNSSVTLLATPASGAKFQGWGGACTGTQTTCSVSMAAAKSVSATFTGGTSALTLTIKVGGKGTVTAPAGTCSSAGVGKTCPQKYSAGLSITLHAAAAKGARFLGWSGSCTGRKLICIVAVKASRTVNATFTGAVTPRGGLALQAIGGPVVKRAGTHFLVTLHFNTTLSGSARVEGLRAGRVVSAFSFRVRPGADTIGPFPVLMPGFFTFNMTIVAGGHAHTIQWPTCVSLCGAKAPASAGAFVVTREQPTIKRAGTAWLVTLHFRETQPSGAEVLVLRHGTLVAHLQFAPGAGESSLGPFVLAPGSYSIKVTATDAYGRVRHLSFTAVLAR